MNNSKIFILLSSLISLCLCNCTMGTGSEVEAKCKLIGKAVYEDGKPVEGAHVRIRSSNYLAIIDKKLFYSYDTVTDWKGYYHFDTVAVDSYTIEINKCGRFGRLVDFSVSAYDSFPRVVPTATLIPTGIMSGRINLPITDDTARPLIAIYGVEYVEKSLITQKFSFNGIPVGMYNLRLIPHQKSNLILELHNIEIFSDSITDVGTLNFTMMKFFKGCNSWECDSLAVRTLLDSNGLQNIPVHSVITRNTETSRVQSLNLYQKGLTFLTKDIGSLSHLKTLTISRNAIVKIPAEIGYLNHLTEFYADSNRITSIPYEICYAGSLKVISLMNNNFQKLPVEMYTMNRLEELFLDNNDIGNIPKPFVKLNLNVFTCKNNRLCFISDETEEWISRYDPDWEASQNCK